MAVEFPSTRPAEVSSLRTASQASPSECRLPHPKISSKGNEQLTATPDLASNPVSEI